MPPPIIPGTSAPRMVPITANTPAILSSSTRATTTLSGAGIGATLVDPNSLDLEATLPESTGLFPVAMLSGQSMFYKIADASGCIVWPFATPNAGNSHCCIALRLWTRLLYLPIYETASGLTIANQTTLATRVNWTCLPLYAATFNCTSGNQIGLNVVQSTEVYATNITTVLNRGYPNQVQLIGNQTAGVITPDAGRVGIKLDALGHTYLQVILGPDSDGSAATSCGALVQMLAGSGG